MLELDMLNLCSCKYDGLTLSRWVTQLMLLKIYVNVTELTETLEEILLYSFDRLDTDRIKWAKNVVYTYI